MTLAGAPLEGLDAAAFAWRAPLLRVAVDRRVWCRVASRPSGILIESKDALTRVEAEDLSRLPSGGQHAWVARILRELGIEHGVSVVTHARVPAGAGLGHAAALATVVRAAAARVFERAFPEDDAGPAGRVARDGGCVLRSLQPLEERLVAVDPAWLEERLRFVATPGIEPGSAAPTPAREPRAAPAIAELVPLLAEAIARHDAAASASAFSAEWPFWQRLWPAPAAVERVVEVACGLGGAAKPCGFGAGLLAVWAEPGARGPGAREAVDGALRAAGLAPIRLRIDLRGLELEET